MVFCIRFGTTALSKNAVNHFFRDRLIEKADNFTKLLKILKSFV